MEIKLIQLLLIASFVAALFLYLKYLRTQLADRMIVVALAIAAVAAVAFPSLTTVVANMVGVGRGTDLVLYAFSACMVFVVILLYSKLARLQEIQTQLVRHLAIRESREIDAERETGKRVQNL